MLGHGTIIENKNKVFNLLFPEASARAIAIVPFDYFQTPFCYEPGYLGVAKIKATLLKESKSVDKERDYVT